MTCLTYRSDRFRESSYVPHQTRPNRLHPKNFNIPKTRSLKLVESILEIIKSTLESGEDVLISGFGKFYMKVKGEQRLGSNPQSGENLRSRGHP